MNACIADLATIKSLCPFSSFHQSQCNINLLDSYGVCLTGCMSLAAADVNDKAKNPEFLQDVMGVLKDPERFQKVSSREKTRHRLALPIR